jgi:hypothetical protein
LRKFAALQNAFNNAPAEHPEGALRDGFTDGRRNHRPHRFLRFKILAAGRFGMLQKSSHQRAFLRAQNPLVPHQRF